MSTTSFLRGTEIVRGGGGVDDDEHGHHYPGKNREALGEAHILDTEARELLYSTVGLSFWGGIDPITGIVIDRTHPLYGRCVTDTILAIPSGRGSCTGSQIMLELILNGTAPHALIVRDPPDPILAVGAIVAQEMFIGGHGDADDGEDEGDEVVVPGGNVPSIVSLSEDRFRQLGDSGSTHVVLRGTTVFHGPNSHDACMAATQADDESLKPASVLRQPELTEEEISILNGVEGEGVTQAQRVAMRVVTRVASICDATNLIPVTGAHIDGCTYVGPGGLLFARSLVRLGGRVVVPTTLNSVSADRRRWRELGVSPALGVPAGDVGDAYVALGASPDSFTCAPYLLGNHNDHTLGSGSVGPGGPPGEGEHVAWGESNAVVYANSVLGARTQKYADYLDVCCALVGRVPAAGPHLDEHRRPSVILDVSDVVERFVLPFVSPPGGGRGTKNDNEGADAFEDDHDVENSGGVDSFFPLLGYVCGNLSDGRVPLILGLEDISPSISTDDLKAMSAAFGTSGSAAMFHASGVTPEACGDLGGALESSWGLRIDGDDGDGDGDTTIPTVRVTVEDFMGAFRDLDGGGVPPGGGGTDDEEDNGRRERVDLVALGNPHLSITECERLAKLCHAADEEKHPDVDLFVTMGRSVHEEAVSRGYVSTLERFGVKFVTDTCWCMLTEPVVPVDPTKTIITNSAKYAHYAPGLVNRRTRFASLVGCVEAARTGVAPPPPRWLGLGLELGGRMHHTSSMATVATVPSSHIPWGCCTSSASPWRRSLQVFRSKWIRRSLRAVVLRR